MKNKIRFRLLLYFSGSLLVFSLVIGLVFAVLFSRHNMDVHKTGLKTAQRTLRGHWPDFGLTARIRGKGVV